MMLFGVSLWLTIIGIFSIHAWDISVRRIVTWEGHILMADANCKEKLEDPLWNKGTIPFTV